MFPNDVSSDVIFGIIPDDRGEKNERDTVESFPEMYRRIFFVIGFGLVLPYDEKKREKS